MRRQTHASETGAAHRSVSLGGLVKKLLQSKSIKRSGSVSVAESPTRCFQSSNALQASSAPLSSMSVRSFKSVASMGSDAGGASGQLMSEQSIVPTEVVASRHVMVVKVQGVAACSCAGFKAAVGADPRIWGCATASLKRIARL
jgi:hypothetical protein